MAELSPTLLHELVERIEIYARNKLYGKSTQQVDIYFNYVGRIGKLDLEPDLPQNVIQNEMAETE